MAFSYCFISQARMPIQASCLGHGPRLPCRNMANQRSIIPNINMDAELISRQYGEMKANLGSDLSIFGSSTSFVRPNLARANQCRRLSVAPVSCLPTSQLASSVFTLGTAAVLPFYTSMVVAPKAEFTKKLMGSSLPYIALGMVYAYLLYLSWTPDTLRLMFSGRNWLPELAAIAKLFSSEMTLASAWIHLLLIDLFAARQVFHDGIQENVETRHSVSLCLLFCPIGVLTHFLTKALTKRTQKVTTH